MSNTFRQQVRPLRTSKENKENRKYFQVRVRAATRNNLAHQKWDEIVEPRKTQGWMTY